MKIQGISAQILTLLEQEIHCYEKLGFLICEQKNILEKKTIDKLMLVIQEKQKLQKAIKILDIKIKENMESLEAEKREQVISQTASIRSRIESEILKIIFIENYCEDFINREKVEIKGKILDLKYGKNIIKGYRSSFLKESFISKKL